MKSFVSLAFLAALSAAASANLVVNGGFEAESYPAGGYTLISSGLTGWDVVGDNVAGIGTNYLLFGNSSQQIDLSGTVDTSGTGIKQLVGTTSGTTYTLAFDVFAGPSFTGYQGGVDVYIDGGLVASNVQGNLSTFTYDFTAGAGGTEVKLLSNNGNVSHVDNVSVTEAVPEPASMAALGLGAVALIRRRKRA